MSSPCVRLSAYMCGLTLISVDKFTVIVLGTFHSPETVLLDQMEYN